MNNTLKISKGEEVMRKVKFIPVIILLFLLIFYSMSCGQPKKSIIEITPDNFQEQISTE